MTIDGEFSIKSYMNNWCLISENLCIKIHVVLDVINVRDEINVICIR